MSNDWQPADYELMRMARHGDISFLEDLDERHFAQREPIISIACPDWRRNCDKIGRIAKFRGYSPAEDHQTHALNWHGGIIRVVPDFPGNTPESARVFLEELVFAVAFTNIWDIVGHIHWPCGWLLSSQVPLKQAFAGHMEAKKIVKAAISQTKVRPIVHSDYADLEPGGMKSYFAQPQRYQERFAQAVLQIA